jgi:RNA polymerase sigma-70 factor (ECF subfamily)
VTSVSAISLSVSDLVRQQLGEAMRRGYVAAFRLLGNPDESRDACQEAAARALTASDRYDPAKPFYPWFHRILRNHCLDRLRKRKRVVHGDGPEPVDGAPTAESNMFQSERSLAVTRGIAALPDELREIIELRHFQDASYEEIAAILACPLGTVMSRLYRARKVLRGKLARDPGFSGHSEGGAA